MPLPKCRLINSDVLEGLQTLPDNSIQCCVTSPPYWGLRDYGIPGQLGLEKTPEEYIEKMVVVFREVKRVLRSDGTCWINLGDSYCSAPAGNFGPNMPMPADGGKFRSNKPKMNYSGLKPKDLCGIPWRLALALQADGWWLRSDIIWHKPNPMPESVTDRPTTAHEHIFLLTKSVRYFYDLEAVRLDPLPNNKAAQGNPQWFPKAGPERVHGTKDQNITKYNRICGPNLRSVWTLSTEPFPEAHFATFPTSIPERCIKAGTSEKGVCPKCGAAWVRIVEKEKSFESGSGKSGKPIAGKNGPCCQGGGDTGDIRKGPVLHTTTKEWRSTCKCPEPNPIPATVLDPFSGAATTLMVAAKLGRDAIGIELNTDYVEMSVKRLKKELGMLVEIDAR